MAGECIRRKSKDGWAQTPENSGAMSGPPKEGQSKEESKEEYAKKTDEFVTEKKEEFKSKEGTEALTSLGEGMHAIMDKTSPSHAGGQEWKGTKGIGNVLKAIGHVIKELNPLRINDKKVKEAAQNVKEYYNQAVKEKAAAAK